MPAFHANADVSPAAGSRRARPDLRACASGTTSTAALPTLGVLSLINDGAVLSSALVWSATPVGVSDSDAARVEFLIDARVRWIEHPSYVFNGDGNALSPGYSGKVRTAWRCAS